MSWKKELLSEFRKEAEKVNRFVAENSDATVTGNVRGYNASLETWLSEKLDEAYIRGKEDGMAEEAENCIKEERDHYPTIRRRDKEN